MSIAKELAMAVLELEVPENVKDMARMVIREEPVQPMWTQRFLDDFHGVLQPNGQFWDKLRSNRQELDALPRSSESDGDVES